MEPTKGKKYRRPERGQGWHLGTGDTGFGSRCMNRRSLGKRREVEWDNEDTGGDEIEAKAGVPGHLR